VSTRIIVVELRHLEDHGFAGFTVAVFSKFDSPDQQAGRGVFVVVPLFGAGAVLGWLLGMRKAPT